MAATGTITAKFSDAHSWDVVGTGITQNSNSQLFGGKALPYSSVVTEGTFGTAAQPTCQWQGSNDGGVSWVNVGTSFTTGPQGGTLAPEGVIYGHYRLLVSGGDAGTSINFYAKFSPSY